MGEIGQIAKQLVWKFTVGQKPLALIAAKHRVCALADSRESQLAASALPPLIFGVLRSQISVSADHHQLKSDTHFSHGGTVVAMQVKERSALEGIAGVKHAAEQFVGISGDARGRDPVAPKVVEQREVVAVVIRRADCHVVRQVGNARPSFLVNWIRRRSVWPVTERKVVRLELPSDSAEIG